MISKSDADKKVQKTGPTLYRKNAIVFIRRVYFVIFVQSNIHGQCPKRKDRNARMINYGVNLEFSKFHRHGTFGAKLTVCFFIGTIMEFSLKKLISFFFKCLF